MGAMPLDERIIGVVDDDDSVRMAVGSLLCSLGFKIEMLGSAEDLPGSAQLDDLAFDRPEAAPRKRRGRPRATSRKPAAHARHRSAVIARRAPVITGTRDPQALTAGALAFIRKPFSENALIDAVRAGLSRGGHRSNPQGTE